MGENATGRLATYYVAECMEFNRYGEYREDIHSAEEAVKIYQENWNKNINTLSGGEKQIVSILKCLVKEADMIIFDEPTSNLDIKRINALLRLIERLKMEKKILLIVSHDSEIIQASDIIIRLGNIQH